MFDFRFWGFSTLSTLGAALLIGIPTVPGNSFHAPSQRDAVSPGASPALWLPCASARRAPTLKEGESF